MFRTEDRQIDFHYRLAVQFAQRRRLDEMAEQIAPSASEKLEERDVRCSLALSLVNMGLLDRGAATWRNLSQTHRVRT